MKAISIITENTSIIERNGNEFMYEASIHFYYVISTKKERKKKREKFNWKTIN